MGETGVGFRSLSRYDSAMIPGKFTRYVLLDVMKVFAVALTVMTTLISLILIGKEMVGQGISYISIVKLLPFILIMALQFCLPATLLFAVCCIYGRISADNEITAIKAAGISPMRIFRPIWLIGFVLSIPSVWLQDQGFSWARKGIQQVVLRSVEQVMYKRLESQKHYNSEKGLVIHVQAIEDRWLIKPTIWMFSFQNSQLATIHSEKARISVDSNRDILTIELVDAMFDLGNGRKWHTFAETFELPLVQASKAGSVEGSASTFSMFDIPNEVKRLYEKNERRKEQLATEMSFHLGTGRYVSLQDPKIVQIKGEVHENEDRMSRLRSEPMRRWALGFGCLAFVWIGVPMAILLKNADYWWTFGLCFIPILLIYYPVLGLSLSMTKKGAWPAVSLWLANLVLIAIGTWFLRRIVKQ